MHNTCLKKQTNIYFPNSKQLLNSFGLQKLAINHTELIFLQNNFPFYPKKPLKIYYRSKIINKGDTISQRFLSPLPYFSFSRIFLEKLPGWFFYASVVCCVSTKL